MSSAGETLKAYLVADTAGVNAIVSGRVHQNSIPIVSSVPHIWFRRSSEQQVTAMDGGTGLYTARFDVECIASSVDSAINLADAVKTRLHAVKTTTGGVNVMTMLVEDHDDDYAPKSIGSDDGLHVSALDLTMWFTT